MDDGADIDARDTNGESPLLTALWFSTTEFCALLIDRGASVQKQPDSAGPLHRAVNRQDPMKVASL